MRLFKYLLAKVLQRRILKTLNYDTLDKLHADRINHLTFLINTKGKVRLDWNKLRLKEVVKCHRCASVIRRGNDKKEGELCYKCTNKG